MPIKLDLMELDGKATPEAVVAEIYRQNPEISFPVPVEEIAHAAGIEDIKPLTSEGFEGMLISDPEKSRGIIFVNKNRPPQRQRFTVGHEIGHFLLPWHRQTAGGSLRFECTAEDMRSNGSALPDSRKDWEIQANEFSSELLMPRHLFKPKMKHTDEPDMSLVKGLSELVNMSLEATARRYVVLSDHPIAVVFAHGKSVRYTWSSSEFPYFIHVRKGSQVPKVSQSYADGDEDTVADFEYIDSQWWIAAARGQEIPDQLLEQTLYQREGYRIILLYIDGEPDED